MNSKVNIVLMVADDHGREALGCYGNNQIKTPNLDALAGDGVRFKNAFCTTASCAASRSVILTGIHNHANGTYGHTHSVFHFSCFDNVISLPKMLNDVGYHTACIGKKHFAPAKVYPFQTDLGGEGSRDDVKMSNQCSDFINNTDEPFFLYWCSFNPHRGGGCNENHPCKPDRFGNPEKSFPGDEEVLFAEEDVIVPSFLPDTKETRAELAEYYQSISRLDRGIGKLIQILKDAGKYENTLILYISDNGAAFPASKTTLYDPGMQLPCLVKSPLHKKRGTVNNGLISWADMTPTILDFAGAYDNPEAFHGKSFKSIIDQENPETWQEEIYASHTFHGITNYYPMRVIRSKKYKFIWNIAHPLTYSSASDLWASKTWQGALRDKLEFFGTRKIDAYLHRPCFELYDLENDPDEINNLAEQSEYKSMVDDYCTKLKEFQKETKDPWQHKWIYE